MDISVSHNSIPPARHVRIIAPASRPSQESIEIARARLAAEGFHVSVDERSFLDAGWTAGSDHERLASLNDAMQDPEIDTILCARGGFGSPKIADLAATPRGQKTIIGYSDITYLLMAMPESRGIHSVHGPMAVDFANQGKKESVDYLIRMLHGEDMSAILASSLKKNLRPLNPGLMEGQLVGGNLTAIQLEIGTRNERKSRNRILFLEEIGERMYALDRSLNHLSRAGLLKNVAGLILGDMTPKADEGNFDLETLWRVVADLARGAKIPAYAGLQVGHGTINLPISYSARIRISP